MIFIQCYCKLSKISLFHYMNTLQNRPGSRSCNLFDGPFKSKWSLPDYLNNGHKKDLFQVFTVVVVVVVVMFISLKQTLLSMRKKEKNAKVYTVPPACSSKSNVK